MLEKIVKLSQKYNMFISGDIVVCGLSGGADSVCLLLSLCELRERLGIEVEALHVNHCLRGSESDRDEDFCRSLCERLGVPFTSERCDVSGYASERSMSTELAARELRYDIFRRNTLGKKLATAHNADDNLETVILNLTRGTALKGLAGIPPVRGNIVRPLLAVTRAEIEAFLAEREQDFVTDSTNLTDDYTRNRIRHRVIPLLREINPSLNATFVSSVDGLRDENAYIEAMTDAAERECLDGNRLMGLAAYDTVIRCRCISRLLTRKNMPVTHERIRECEDILINGGKLNISGDIYFISDGITAELRAIPRTVAVGELSAPLKVGENSIYRGISLICELVGKAEYDRRRDVNKKLTFYALDYDKIKGEAVLRNRRNGDRIQLRGRDFRSSVKKLINENIPPEERGTLHFIEDSEGTVFAEKLGIAQRVAPDGNTKRLFIISVVNDKQEWSGSIDTKKK